MKKALILFLLIGLVVLVGCSNGATNSTSPNVAENNTNDGSSEVKVMKMAVATPKERSYSAALIKFGEIVETETGGKIKAEVYTDGQLGGDVAVYEAMKMGTIQGSTMSTGPVASFAKEFGVLDLPFLFVDKATAYEVLDGPVGQQLLDVLPATGVIGLNYWENGYRHLTNNERVVKTPEDVSGLKLRTMESQIHLDFWKGLGANPTPMPFTELFTALEQGVVNGQENPFGIITTSNFYEVQKHLSTTGHVYSANVLLLSKKFWDTLSKEEKQVIEKAAAEAQTYQRELNEQEDAAAIKLLTEKGMTITELTVEEKQKFVEKAQPIYEKYSKELGEELVNKLLEAVNQ